MDYLFEIGWTCGICGSEYDKKPLARCSRCGAYIEPKHLWEYWDQSDPRYTDEALKRFAREATRFLLEPEYRKAKMVYDVRIEILKTQAKVSGKDNWGLTDYLGEWGKKTPNTIYYCLPTLRHKKQCAHNVAHECAHASPACWDIVINQPHLHLQSKKGHHNTHFKKLWEYKAKLKTKFPDYCSD
jgi:hypothetical protein